MRTVYSRCGGIGIWTPAASSAGDRGRPNPGCRADRSSCNEEAAGKTDGAPAPCHVGRAALGLGPVVNGWLNYYAVPTSARFLRSFTYILKRIWLKALRPHTPLSALERRLRELDHLDAALQDELADDVDDTAKDGENLDPDTADACQGTHLRRPPLDDTTNESGFEETTVAGGAGREGDGVAKPDPRDMLHGDGPDDIPIREFVAIMPPIVRLRLP